MFLYQNFLNVLSKKNISGNFTKWYLLRTSQIFVTFPISGTFFAQNVLRYWNRLHRETVDAPTLEMFKTRLDGTLSSLS